MARTMDQMEAGDAPLVTENMVVVKLENGGLLLYCPVGVQQVRKKPRKRRSSLIKSHNIQGSEFSNWLKTQGEVAWIVLGSSEHTLQLPDVLAR